MTVILPVLARTKENKSKIIEQIPAVVYGPKYATTSILVDKKEFERTFKTAGESTVIELQGLESPVEVLVKDVAFAPTKGGIIHVDFYALEKGKEITTNIPLSFVGEAPAIKLGAIINKVLHEVTVVCKPSNLPNHLDVDLTKLVLIDDQIHVSDIVCPKGVVIEQDGHDVVALCETIEEEVEPVVEEIAAADVPVEAKGKTEDKAE